MKYLVVFVILVSLNTESNAQRKTVVPYEDKWALRISPLSLVDVFDGNITMGAACTLNNRFTFTADVSYIFYSTYIERNKAVSGYIFKPALRYYLSKGRRFFLEGAPFYKHVGYKIHDWLGRDEVNGVPSYTELTDFRLRKRVAGLNLMAGVQKSLMKSDQLRMEIYAGIALRYKWQDIKGDPRATYDANDLFNTSAVRPGELLPGLPHGLRLVYVIDD